MKSSHRHEIQKYTIVTVANKYKTKYTEIQYKAWAKNNNKATYKNQKQHENKKG